MQKEGDLLHIRRTVNVNDSRLSPTPLMLCIHNLGTGCAKAIESGPML